MNSNHPITEAELKSTIFATLAAYGLRTVSETAEDKCIAALTALCRSFAASELRAAAGSDEPMPSRSKGNADMYVELIHYAEARNELRRTLRVRASELEKENE